MLEIKADLVCDWLAGSLPYMIPLALLLIAEYSLLYATLSRRLYDSENKKPMLDLIFDFQFCLSPMLWSLDTLICLIRKWLLGEIIFVSLALFTMIFLAGIALYLFYNCFMFPICVDLNERFGGPDTPNLKDRLIINTIIWYVVIFVLSFLSVVIL